MPQALDLQLQRLEKGLTSGSDNLLIDRELRSAPAPEGVLAPITTAVPTSIPPVAYVVHRWAKHCLTCGSIHYYSDVFALNHLKTNWGKYVRNMTPISRPEWNVPLTLHELPPKAIPFCHECLDLAKAHLEMLPSPPVPQQVTGSGNITPQASAPKAPSTPKGKKVWDTDDLLSGL